MSKKLKIILVIILILATVLVFMAFNKKNSQEERVLRLAIPSVLHSGPIFVLDELNLLEKYVPNVKLELTIIENGSAVNEAFLANQIDGGLHNITNFLIGIDKNIPYKILTSLSHGTISIQTNNPEINSFKDIKKSDIISMGSLTGTSGLILRLATQQYFGNYNALDEQIIIMGRDESQMALINKSGGITLAISDLAGRKVLEESGCKTILEDRELFEGDLLTTCLVFSENYYNENKDIMEGFLKAVEEAIELLYEKDENALEIVTKKTGMEKADFIEQLDSKDQIYLLNSYSSIDVFADMSINVGLISSKKSLDNIIFNYSGN